MPFFVRLRRLERVLFFLGHRRRFDFPYAARRNSHEFSRRIFVLVSAVLEFRFMGRGNLRAVAQFDDIGMDATAEADRGGEKW